MNTYDQEITILVRVTFEADDFEEARAEADENLTELEADIKSLALLGRMNIRDVVADDHLQEYKQ